MTDKRFTVDTFIADYPCGFKDLEDNECEVFCDGNRMTYREVTDLLNELNDKCEFLEIENESLEEGATKYAELYHKSLKENEQLKQSNERIVKDIDLALGFIRHKGYSLQDIKDYEDAKKEYEEDLANYRKGDVE